MLFLVPFSSSPLLSCFYDVPVYDVPVYDVILLPQSFNEKKVGFFDKFAPKSMKFCDIWIKMALLKPNDY